MRRAEFSLAGSAFAVSLALLAIVVGGARADEAPPAPGSSPGAAELTAACNATLRADDGARLAYMRELQAQAAQVAKLQAQVIDLEKQLEAAKANTARPN